MSEGVFWVKNFKLTLLAILGVEILSFFVVGVCRVYWHQEWLNQLFLVLICAAIFLLSLKKLEYGFYAAVLELFIGSKGHLFYFLINDFKFSLRLGLFIVVCLAWLIHLFKTRKTRVIESFALKRLLWLVAVIAWGILWSLINRNSLVNLFLDVNAWLYFGYAVVFIDCLKDRRVLNNVLAILSASVVAVSVKTLTLLYLFSHQFLFLEVVYKWVRDTGVGEITLASGSLYRVFFQSQIFVLIAFIILTAWLVFQNRRALANRQSWYVAGIACLCLATTLINLSRSNWLGLVAGIFVLLILMLVRLKFGWRKIFKAVGFYAVLGVGSVVLILATIYFPLPKVNVDASDMLKDRFGEGAAISSRANQVRPLLAGIAAHPLIGSGWGKTVTYKTQDPRFLATHPDGLNNTYAFELGYLEMILKIGILGLIIYGALIFKIFSKGWWLLRQSLENDDKAIILGLLGGLSALVVIHAFSPYLNHPLGIGFILLAIAMIEFYRREKIVQKN